MYIVLVRRKAIFNFQIQFCDGRSYADTMSLVHILLSRASMPSVLFFILAEQKNEQHTPIILFTPNICNESEGNLFVLNNLLSIFYF